MARPEGFEPPAYNYGNFQWSRPQTVTYPGNIVRTQTFDALMGTQTITVKNAQNATLMAYGYAYDAVGNITTKSTEHGDYRYGYDALDRLTRADYPNGPNNDQINQSFEPNTFPFKDDQFSYDLLGNRLTDQAQTTTAPWQYNANNELLNSGLNLYAYNENGSTIEKKAPNDQIEQRYVYNSEERLAEVKDATDQTIASYYYDPFGRRLWKTVAPNQPGNDSASPKTTYLYHTDEGYAAEYAHAGNHPSSEATITPTPSQLYLFAPEGLWSTEPIAIKQTGATPGWRYPETDHLGTPHGLISKDGQETTDLRANAFGQTELTGEPLPLRFAGQTQDDETGGYYNFHRDYESGLGRYGGVDPIGIGSGINSYIYSNSNSIIEIDPTGEAPVAAGAAAAARAIILACTRSPKICRAIILCIRNPKACTKAMFKGMCDGYQKVCKSQFSSSSSGAGSCNGNEGCMLSLMKCTHFMACCTMRTACNICRFAGMGHPDKNGNRTPKDQPTEEECKKAGECCVQADEKCRTCEVL